MRRLALILLSVLIAAPAFGQDFVMLKKKVAAASGDECAGYLICFNFEETGTPAGLTLAGSSANPDNTVDPLRGLESLGFSQANTTNYGYMVFDNTASVHFFFRYSTDNTAQANSPFLQIRATDNSVLAKLYQLATGEIRAYSDGSGTHADTSGLGMDNSVSVCMWGDVTRGAGTGDGTFVLYADNCAEICTGGTCTKPGAPVINMTTGTWDSADAMADNIKINGVNTRTATKFDQFLKSSEVIGNVPQ